MHDREEGEDSRQGSSLDPRGLTASEGGSTLRIMLDLAPTAQLALALGSLLGLASALVLGARGGQGWLTVRAHRMARRG